jgi:acyl carrier protein
MTDNELKLVIRGMIKQDTGLRVPLSTLGDDANLFDSGMNSLGTVMLIMSLEGKYGFDFPEEFLNRESFKSINAIAESVQSVLTKSIKTA